MIIFKSNIKTYSDAIKQLLTDTIPTIEQGKEDDSFTFMHSKKVAIIMPDNKRAFALTTLRTIDFKMGADHLTEHKLPSMLASLILIHDYEEYINSLSPDNIALLAHHVSYYGKELYEKSAKLFGNRELLDAVQSKFMGNDSFYKEGFTLLFLSTLHSDVPLELENDIKVAQQISLAFIEHNSEEDIRRILPTPGELAAHFEYTYPEPADRESRKIG